MESQIFSAARPTASCILRGDGRHPELMGEVQFSPYGQGTLVVARVVGLPPARFLGLHIHENGDCATGGDVSFASAGGHFDLGGKEHPGHTGDLPPLLASQTGTALLAVYTDRFRPADVVGRAVVIHAMPDDFRTQPAGDSGMRIACGVIREA